jgi:hypothetical protein
VTAPTPRRVTVTGPRTTAARRPSGALRRQSVEDQDVVGDLLVRALVRAQLHLALRTGGALALTLGSLPLLFAFVPASRTAHLLGLPLPWLLLGVVVYPALVLVGFAYVRVAERHERDFVELVGDA